MRLVSSLTSNFAERNLVLHGVLGLLSASDRLTRACAAEASLQAKSDGSTPSVEELAEAPALAFALLGLLALSSKLREEFSLANEPPPLSSGVALHRSSSARPGRHDIDLLR
jgi:hypothetical protein